MHIKSPANSPNTDGIHLYKCKDVKILDSVIASGDDCVSIGGDSSNVEIKNITCKSGHGISIGSLGLHNSRECVSNITVTNSTIKHSDNGVRIKTWQGGSGSVSNVTFDKTSYIKGSYNATQYPVNLACSDTVPCTNLTFYEVEFKPVKGQQTIMKPFCWDAYGDSRNSTPPVDCLLGGISKAIT